MKKLLLALSLVAMMAGSAFAFLDDGVNSLGVYFDSPVFEQSCFTPTAFVPFNVYFVLANPEFNNLGGFEFGWRFEPLLTGFILATNLPSGALNIGTNNNLIVGLGTGLITSEATVLVNFQIMASVVPTSPTWVQVGPAQPASLPLHAAFNDFNNPANIIPMNFSTVNGQSITVNPQGWVVPGLGSLFCPGPVATESATWGSVKALFE
jgi:hypothetical protein